MKTKILLIVCLLSGIQFTSLGQTLTADFSKGVLDGRHYFSDGLETTMGNHLVLKENIQTFGGLIKVVAGKKASILLQNSKNETLKETPVIFKDDRFVDIRGLYLINGKKILVYGYKESKKAKEFGVSAITLDDSGIAANEVELGRFGASTGRDIPFFNFWATSDSSVYLLFVEADQGKKDLKKFDYVLLNNNLVKQFENSVELTEEKRYVSIAAKTVDHKGNLLVVFKHFEKAFSGNEPENDKYYGAIPYTTTLMQYDAGGKSSGAITINLGGKELQDARIIENGKSGKLSIAGTYKNGAKGGIGGAFYCDYDPQTKVASNVKVSAFPAQLLDALAKEGFANAAADGGGISGNFGVRELSARNNGTIDYKLEFNRTDKVTHQAGMSFNNAPPPMETYYTFYSHSILNININQDGAMIFTRISKNQRDINTNFDLSHYSFYSGNKLIFLFNDDRDNVGLDASALPAQFDAENTKKATTHSVLMAAIIDEKGNVERKMVFDNKDDKYLTVIGRLTLMRPNLVFCSRTKTGSFLEDVVHQKDGVIVVNP
jgi:hypothetical protein